MLGENPSYDSVPLKDIAEIQAIIETMQTDPLFKSINHDAQVRTALLIKSDPVGYAKQNMGKVKIGLEQDEPLLVEAELLINQAFKVASEYGENYWLVNEISQCIVALCSKKTAEVREKVLVILGYK